MSANFNPYHYWLGYPAHFMPRNHYETLGISPQERDLNRIAQAADALAGRVQNSPPGGFIMEWQQLLTSIQTAKMCLCNPSSRANYDAQMGFSQPQSGFGGASFGPPTPSAANYTGNVAAPPGMSQPAGMNTGFAPPPPRQPAAPAYTPPASSGTTYEYSNHISSYMPPGQTAPAPQPQAPPSYSPPVPQGTAVPQAVHVPQAAPMGMPAAAMPQNMPTMPSAEPESLFSGAPSPAPSGTSSTAAVARAYKKSLSNQRLMVVALLAVVIALLGFIFFGKTLLNPDSGVQVAANGNHTGGPIALPGEGGGEDSASATPAAAENGKKNEKAGKNGEKTRPAGLPPSTNPAFRKCCNGIRADLGRQDVAAAREQLAELEKIASTDAEKEEFARLTALTDSVEKFVDVVAGAMGSFRSGTSVKLNNANDDRVSIVESERGKLIVKQAGRNTTYTLDNLTPRVAEFVLTRNRSEKLDFNVHYGAYLATNHTPDLEAARQKWTIAEQRGNDVSLLWPELDVPRGAEAHVSHATAEAEEHEAPVEIEDGAVIADMADDPAAVMTADAVDASDSSAVSSDDRVIAAAPKDRTGRRTGPDGRYTGAGAGGGGAANTGAAGAGKTAGKTVDATDTADAKDEETPEPAKPAADTGGEFRKLVQGARGNIEWNEIDEAKAKLAKAKPLAKTDAEQEELNRLEALAEYMGDFLEWAGRAMAAQQSMDQITIAGEHMGVVESGPGYLRLRRAGNNVTYTTDSIDPVMADFLVGGIAKDSPDNRVLYGTFHAMNPEGNRSLAKQLWQEAQQQGFETSFLMPELDVPHVNQTRRKGGGAIGPRQAQVQRLAVPTEDEQAAALAAVKQTFAREYAKEMNLREKDQFAEKLGKQVSDRKNTPAQQYVLLLEAARVATENQRYLTAYKALLGIQQRFSENTFDQRKALVTEADADARGSLSAAEVAECALTLAAEAYEVKNSKTEAAEMLKIAEPLLKTAKKPNLNAVYKQLQQKVGAML